MKNALFFNLFVLTMSINAQQPSDSLTKPTVQLDEVLVSSVRVKASSPVSFSNLNKAAVAPRNLGQDIPILLGVMPAVVTTSDAGAGVGYTGLRVRGSDATRINVTINGIPLNDAESHGVWWVNMPDFVSSVESLQLQRGVGSSTQGAGAFGASLNLLTDAISVLPQAQISSSFGSFGTFKNSVQFSTGLLDHGWEINGRLSAIQSDGYIDRASSDLKSYFLQATYQKGGTLIKALTFGGHEITYQSWNGVDAQQLKDNRTYNSAGAYTDPQGNLKFYDNEVDDYKQTHYQLHWHHQMNAFWRSNLSVHYTKGAGFYEQYKEDQDFGDYGLNALAGVTETDLIRRKWLDNDFMGLIASLQYQNKGIEWIFGLGGNRYEGQHFGEVIWARYASNSEIRHRYYDNFSKKRELNAYTKATYPINKSISVFMDLQYRVLGYQAQPEDIQHKIDDHFQFFNPKFGATYRINAAQSLYASFGRAHREPNRTDYENGNPKPEQLNDYEIGWRFNREKFQSSLNVYYMHYKDQLVLTGALDAVGAPIRANVGNSYRLGLEWDAQFSFGPRWRWLPNFALSQNRNLDYRFRRDGVLQNLGATEIAFSPSLVAGQQLFYSPVESLSFGLISKHVGSQYMGNIDAKSSKLAAYTLHDLSVSYWLKPKKIFEKIEFNLLINNILNQEYISNGYFYTYDDTWSNHNNIKTIEGAGYYPQAGRHFLAGLVARF